MNVTPTRAWAEQKIVREIMVFLQSHGVGTSRAVRIFKTYGADAIPLVTENPYRLARDIRGIGFRTADTIAKRLGIPKDSMIRARAGVSYALLEAVANGHCGLPKDDLLTLTEGGAAGDRGRPAPAGHASVPTDGAGCAACRTASQIFTPVSIPTPIRLAISA